MRYTNQYFTVALPYPLFIHDQTHDVGAMLPLHWFSDASTTIRAETRCVIFWHAAYICCV